MIDGANTVVSRSDSATARSASALARKKREGECSLAFSVEKNRNRFTPPCSEARRSRTVATAFTSSIDAPSRSRMAAARWITVSTPRSALRNEAGFARSPSAICTLTRSPPSRRGSRTRQRTGLRAATSRRSSAVPTLPLAPVSRITSTTLEPVALLFPGVGVVVVAVQLPEAHAVLAHQLELAHELRRLPEVALRHEQPQRAAVVVLERLAVEGMGQQHVVVQNHLERQVRGVAAVRVRHHELRLGLHSCTLQQVRYEHPAPGGVELAPASHAVDVGDEVLLRQSLQLVPGELQLVLDLAIYLEVPRAQVVIGIRTDREHRKAVGQILARRHPIRVDSELLGLALSPGAQHAGGDGHGPSLGLSSLQS